MKYLAAFAIAICMPSVSVAADYVTVGLGASVWPRTSNSDELEASAAPGPALSVIAGWGASDAISRELSVSYRRNDVHGINVGDEHLSGDGNRLHALSVHYGARADVYRNGQTAAFVRGGIGATYIAVRYEYEDSGRRISDSDLAPSAILGTGIEYHMHGGRTIGIGYEYLRPMAMQIGWEGHNLKSNYDTHNVYMSVGF